MKNSKADSLVGHLTELWCFLEKKRKIQFGMVLFLAILTSLSEVISLGAIVPFIGVITSPDKVLSYPYVKDVLGFFSIKEKKDLIFVVTFLFVLSAVLAGVLRVISLWLSSKVAFSSGSDLSVLAYRKTLYQPYSVHLNRNSSGVIAGISNKISASVSLLYQVLVLISSLIIMVSVMVTIIIINPQIAFIAAVFFGLIYFALTKASRKKLVENGKIIAREQTIVVKTLQEGLGAIRDVLLMGTQEVYCREYQKADISLRLRQASNIVIGGSPRYLMESVGVVVISIIAYILSTKETAGLDVLPTIGVLALGAQRLLPLLQNCFSAWSSIAGSQASLVDTLGFLRQEISDEVKNSTGEVIPLKSQLEFSHVGFRYKKDSDWILKDLNLTIKHGSRVGIVGHTGSGKSTTLDILMGLLRPTEGVILVDGKKIEGEDVAKWQRAIAHVPQSIFLIDASILENIALGVPAELIDVEKVKQVAILSRVSEFIDIENGGLRTIVGERGAHLSGGQRQRIGIARALYRNASILVMDEATSALDNLTEKNVMDGIQSLDRNLTIVLIAHRLSTIENCDMVVELKSGAVQAQGSYVELLNMSPTFRQIALLENNK